MASYLHEFRRCLMIQHKRLFHSLSTSRSYHQDNQQSTPPGEEEVNHSYHILNLLPDASIDQVRESYLELAKRYHPDSSSRTADAQQFAVIENAYRTIVNHQQKQKETKNLTEETTEFDIKHVAPQHRQYLSNEGVGYGTPSARQRQYQQVRVSRAIENVTDYRTSQKVALSENALMTKTHGAARKKNLRSAIDRLVEDLIIESMSKGEFDDLPGKGKPLADSSYNPMVDSTTHNLNRILIENGYAPEWVMLDKDIKRNLKDCRDNLLSARIRAGPEPLHHKLKYNWDKSVNEFCEKMEQVNQDVIKLNMLVPTMNQQIIPYNTNREINRVLELYHQKVSNGEILEVPKNDELYYEPIDPEAKVKLKDIVKEIRALFSA